MTFPSGHLAALEGSAVAYNLIILVLQVLTVVALIYTAGKLVVSFMWGK